MQAALRLDDERSLARIGDLEVDRLALAKAVLELRQPRSVGASGSRTLAASTTPATASAHQPRQSSRVGDFLRERSGRRGLLILEEPRPRLVLGDQTLQCSNEAAAMVSNVVDHRIASLLARRLHRRARLFAPRRTGTRAGSHGDESQRDEDHRGPEATRSGHSSTPSGPTRPARLVPKVSAPTSPQIGSQERHHAETRRCQATNFAPSHFRFTADRLTSRATHRGTRRVHRRRLATLAAWVRGSRSGRAARRGRTHGPRCCPRGSARSSGHHVSRCGCHP